jgi:hypothetical protein
MGAATSRTGYSIQRRIRILGATLVWEDEVRAAAPLILEDVDFALDNDGRQHRFGLTALPPGEAASRIDVRGDLRGRSVERPASVVRKALCRGRFGDLAVWKQWVDYPSRCRTVAVRSVPGLMFADGKLRAK